MPLQGWLPRKKTGEGEPDDRGLIPGPSPPGPVFLKVVPHWRLDWSKGGIEEYTSAAPPQPQPAAPAPALATSEAVASVRLNREISAMKISLATVRAIAGQTAGHCRDLASYWSVDSFTCCLALVEPVEMWW